MNWDGFQLGDPRWLAALSAAAAITLLAAWSAWRRGRILRRFASVPRLRELASSASAPGRGARATMIVAAAGLLALALSRPQADPQPVTVERTGRDIVVLLDVSRSMLATDLAPTRLDRAKLWIQDLSASLRGDRIALVTFAGAARVECPLTLDRAFFRMTLDEASPDDITLGGTAIGDAIRKAVRDVFELSGSTRPPGPAARDLVLITDGEDHESLPTEAASAAGKLGVRLIAIGLGDPAGGAIVPAEDDRPLRRDGQIVRSRMDAATLASIASATPGGVFLNVGTGTISLDRVYQDLVASAEQVSTGSSTIVRHREFFQWPLVTAILLLAVEPWLPTRRRRPSMTEATA